MRNVEFSSGGWQPKYGDKLASVLSVDYKTPEKFAASLTGSLVAGRPMSSPARPMGGELLGRGAV